MFSIDITLNNSELCAATNHTAFHLNILLGQMSSTSDSKMLEDVENSDILSFLNVPAPSPSPPAE